MDHTERHDASKSHRTAGPTFSQWLLALFFIGAGIMHFIFPQAYISIMPPWLGWHAMLVLISGIAECAGGVGMLWAPARRYAGWGLMALCVAVLPANVQMLIDAVAQNKAGWVILLLVLRLPLQLLLMQWIWRAAELSSKLAEAHKR
ncbi:MAG: hypothetical protein V4695_07590 [Pseudomonadota bacterium]